MCRRRGSKLCIILAVVLGVAAKPPPPPGAPWAPYASKPVYYRSVGPPANPGMSTISVPYMPKSTMFPKFVDPKMMIAKKTEFLGNLFGGMGPVDASGNSPFYPKLGAVDTDSVLEKRGLFGPMMAGGGMMGPGGPMMGPGGPMMGPGGPMMGPGGPMMGPGSPMMGQGGPMSKPGPGGPMSSMGPGGPMGGKGMKGPMFNPFFSKFGGMFGSKFSPGGFGSPMDSASPYSPDSFSRRRRSVETMVNTVEKFSSDPTKPTTKYMGPPPPYPGLATITEETEKQLYNLFGGNSPAFSKAQSADTFEKSKSTVHDKRGIFGAMLPFGFAPMPMAPMYSPLSPMMNPLAMSPLYNPANPLLNPMLSKYGLMPPNLPLGPSVDSSTDSTTRMRRSVEPVENVESTEEPETKEMKTPLLKLFAPGFFPGMYSPFGPMYGPGGPMYGPGGPMVGPAFAMSKKAAFLDTLFKTLATSTPAPALAPALSVTDAPLEKSTIVPPNFWLPSSVIPGPTEYSQKVSQFLDKLFSQLALNVTQSAETPEDSEAATVKVARSVDDYAKIADAKDAIVDSILSELGAIKTNMISTMNDLITYEKSLAFNPLIKKPFKNLATNLWPSPTSDATMPFQQRMALLGQVFDMLTAMQRNITTTAQQAMKVQMATTEAPVQQNYFPSMGDYSSLPGPSSPVFNTTLLDAIRDKLAAINIASATPSGYGFPPQKFARSAPTSIWVAHPPTTPESKREADDYQFFDDQYRNNPRSVKMQMHQGYQSMPPGAIETVQAGGNSVPGHQGGGINLHIQMPASNSRTPDFENKMQNYNEGQKWAEWGEYLKKEFEDSRRHHHNRH